MVVEAEADAAAEVHSTSCQWDRPVLEDLEVLLHSVVLAAGLLGDHHQVSANVQVAAWVECQP